MLRRADRDGTPQGIQAPRAQQQPSKVIWSVKCTHQVKDQCILAKKRLVRVCARMYILHSHAKVSQRGDLSRHSVITCSPSKELALSSSAPPSSYSHARSAY
jgi:hypothetical protein